MATSATIKRANKRLPTGTRDKILDAAEIEFSNYGYDSCSMRIIADKYNINLGLIHYYFRSKQGLFTEVFLRRSKKLVNRRNEMLSAALLKSNNQPVPLSEIVRCFIAPTVEMIKEGDGPRAYIRLQGLLRTDTSRFARELRAEAFSTTNRVFIRELQRSCPHLPPASVVWRFSAMVGAFYSLASQSGRVSELSDGLVDSDDIDAAFAEVIPFVAGGFEASPPGESDRLAISSSRPS